MSLLTHALTFIGGGSFGAVVAALLFAYGEREKQGEDIPVSKEADA